jgi:hypothetical protein
MTSVVGDMLSDLREYYTNLLKEESKPGGQIEGVKKIVYGTTFSIEDLELPAVWIVPQAYTPDESAGFTSVEHRFLWTFYGTVYNSSPSKGAGESESLTFAVREILRRNPQPPGIDDARSTSFNPAQRVSQTKLVFSSSVDMEFFTVIEE